MYLIGKRLIELREQKGLNQKELAELIGVHPAVISHLEQNRRGATLDQAVRLAKAFAIKVDDLLPMSAQEAA